MQSEGGEGTGWVLRPEEDAEVAALWGWESREGPEVQERASRLHVETYPLISSNRSCGMKQVV